jgi:hypothetical protein
MDQLNCSTFNHPKKILEVLLPRGYKVKGCNGLYRYNNQDHSMMMAMLLAVDLVASNKTDKINNVFFILL